VLLAQIEQIQEETAGERSGSWDLPQAAYHWYEDRYLPVVDLLTEQNLMRHYPNRTETDLYVWLLENHQALAEELDWDLHLDAVAADLAHRKRSGERLSARLRSVVDPNAATGDWRRSLLGRRRGRMFSDIVVLLENPETAGSVLAQAIDAAGNEGAHLLGLYLPPAGDDESSAAVEALFDERCRAAGVEGQLTTSRGPKNEVLQARSRWLRA